MIEKICLDQQEKWEMRLKRVEFVWLSSPKSFIGTKKVEAVEVNKMKLGEPDSSGRRRPEIDKGSEYKIKADLGIKSLGFDPENLPSYLTLKN